jgi:ATP-dependent Lon protease
MEVLELQGYTEFEKLQIAKSYLIPRQVEENGLDAKDIAFSDDSIRFVIRRYTREAGVRNLEREIGTICRKQARRIAEKMSRSKSKAKTAAKKLTVTLEVVEEFLRSPRYREELEIAERTERPGVALGLAWTAAGGDVLFIEATAMPGGGKGMVLTGQLGKVMQESMQAALSWVRSHAPLLGLPASYFRSNDLHVHVPAGAIPKDGPSAGVTVVSALVSLATGRRVRPYLAMTGEITLSGNVLPVGGIKEKVLAARRSGVTEVILPHENESDVKDDLNEEQLGDLKVHYVKSVSEVIAIALEKKKPAKKKAVRKKAAKKRSR